MQFVGRKQQIMAETLLIKGGPDYIEININSQPYPHGDNEWDRSWLDSTVVIQLGAFSGTFQANLQTWDFEKLLNEFRVLNSNLEHSFEYEATEQQIGFKCTTDGIGHIELSGQIMDQCGIGNELSFIINLDQSYIPNVIEQLKRINKTFPVLR